MSVVDTIRSFLYANATCFFLLLSAAVVIVCYDCYCPLETVARKPDVEDISQLIKSREIANSSGVAAMSGKIELYI